MLNPIPVEKEVIDRLISESAHQHEIAAHKNNGNDTEAAGMEQYYFCVTNAMSYLQEEVDRLRECLRDIAFSTERNKHCTTAYRALTGMFDDESTARSKFEIKNGDAVLKEPASEIDRLKCALIEARIELAKTPKFVELLTDIAQSYEGIGNVATVLREIARSLPVELGGNPKELR